MKPVIISLIAAVLSAALLAAGCRSRNTADKFVNPVNIFILSDENPDWFEKISGFNGINAQFAGKPWPDSLRITDISESGGKVFIAVNKKGLAVPESLQFKTISHDAFVKYSSGRIIENDNKVLCHVYLNTFFSSQDIKPPESPFVAFNSDSMSAGYSSHDFPEETVKEYSMSELRKNGEKWVSAWKKSSSGKTYFRFYSHEKPSGEGIREIAEDSFYSSVKPLEKGFLPDYVSKAIEKITGDASDGKTVADVSIRKSGGNSSEEYYYTSGGNGSLDMAEHAEKICVCESENGFYLSWKGFIFLADSSGCYRLALPEKLPENHKYTALLSSSSRLYAAWEEEIFFLTGRAGLTIIDEKSIDKIPQ